MFLGLGSLIGMLVEQLWCLRAWPPFFVIPLFAFKLAFWAVLLRPFGKSFTRWSGLPHLKQLDHVGKMDNIPN